MNIHDARARYTRQVIREQFLALLREKPVSKITVTELCAACRINRATFYKHYQDVYDLLDQLERDCLAGQEALLRSRSYSDLADLFSRCLTFYRDRGADWAVLGSANGDPSFYARIFEQGYREGYPRLKDNADLPEGERQMLFQFLSQGAGAVMHCWVKGGMKESTDEVASLLARAVTGCAMGFSKKAP